MAARPEKHYGLKAESYHEKLWNPEPEGERGAPSHLN